jgi:hypothetical protein
MVDFPNKGDEQLGKAYKSREKGKNPLTFLPAFSTINRMMRFSPA